MAAIEFAVERPETFWPALQKHLPPITDAVRAELGRILSRYYRHAQHEENAPEVALAREKLDALRKAALTFAHVVWSRGESSTDAESGAAGHLETVINAALRRASFCIYRRPYNDPLQIQQEGLLTSKIRDITRDEARANMRPLSVSMVSELMTEFVGSCDEATRELDVYERCDFYGPGEAWRDFVSDLADFFDALPGLKATTRKDRKPNTPPSPFTAFVNTVQFQLPERFRRYDTYSTPELAGTPLESAVSKALAGRKAAREAEHQRALTAIEEFES